MEIEVKVGQVWDCGKKGKCLHTVKSVPAPGSYLFYIEDQLELTWSLDHVRKQWRLVSDAPVPAKPTPRAGQVWSLGGLAAHWLLQSQDIDGHWRAKCVQDGIVTKAGETCEGLNVDHESTWTLIRDVEEKAPVCIELKLPPVSEQFKNITATLHTCGRGRPDLSATAADQAREESQRRRAYEYQGSAATDARIAMVMQSHDAAYAESEKQRRDKEAIAAKWEQERATMLWGRSPWVGGYNRRGGR